jgi:Photosynthetic reaction centre cytochrome C subunit
VTSDEWPFDCAAGKLARDRNPRRASASVQQTNDAFVEKITKQIVGHEQEPAEEVFKNIQILKNVPAGRLLLIMNLGYSRAVGVACTHCHVERDFSSDDKRPKRAAREMAVMHRSFNDQLTKMQNLDPVPQGHFINCSTCHRGAVDPMASDK